MYVCVCVCCNSNHFHIFLEQILSPLKRITLNDPIKSKQLDIWNLKCQWLGTRRWFFAKYSGFLHYLQLASHELATIGINVTKNEIPPKKSKWGDITDGHNLSMHLYYFCLLEHIFIRRANSMCSWWGDITNKHSINMYLFYYVLFIHIHIHIQEIHKLTLSKLV